MADEFADDAEYAATKYREAAESCKRTIASLQQCKDDYEQVSEILTTLPDTLGPRIMAPLGPLAFMPGKIKHTNEIMVLLGDNIFAKRSAKQSVEIIQRRIEQIDQSLEANRKELANFEKFANLSSDIADDEHDIVEEGEVEEIEGGGRIKRNKDGTVEIMEDIADHPSLAAAAVPAAPSSAKVQTGGGVVAAKVGASTDSGKNGSSGGGSGASSKGVGVVTKPLLPTREDVEDLEKRIMHMTQMMDDASEEEDDEDEDEDDDMSGDGGSSSEEQPVVPVVRSPADIYEMMRAKAVSSNSINNSGGDGGAGVAVVKESHAPPNVAGSSTANSGFSGVVRERPADVAVAGATKVASASASAADTKDEAPKKPMSKFAMERRAREGKQQ